MERGQGDGRLRLFAALTIPSDVLDAIGQWWETARHALPRRGWRPIPRENWHLTMAFYGEIDGGLLGDLEQALSRELAGLPPVDLGSRGVGTFPSPERPRVFWLGIDGPGLERIARHCRGAVEALPARAGGRSGDEHPFKGHLTLARARQGRRFDPRCLLAMPPPPTLQWHAETLDLYRSRLSPDGARYEILTRYALQAPSDTPSPDTDRN